MRYMGFNFDNIFFHGTKKILLDEIANKGLETRNGRATFTQNPKYATNYSGNTKKEIIKDGLLLVFKNKNIKKAKDSEIVLKRKQKLLLDGLTDGERNNLGTITA